MGKRQGWVCMHRKIDENPISKKPLTCHLFLYLLRNANHKNTTIIWNKKEITIERGSIIVGRKSLALETGLSEQSVRTALRTLYNCGMVLKSTSKSTNKYTYLTICHYSDYQDYISKVNHESAQQATSKQPASNQQATTNNNVNNENNENKKEKEDEKAAEEKALLKERMQKSFQQGMDTLCPTIMNFPKTNEIKKRAKKGNLTDEELDQSITKFCEYYSMKYHPDWESFFFPWLRREIEYKKRKKGKGLKKEEIMKKPSVQPWKKYKK